MDYIPVAGRLQGELRTCYMENQGSFQTSMKLYQKFTGGASPVAQWLRICLPMQGTQVEPWSGKISHAAEQLGP